MGKYILIVVIHTWSYSGAGGGLEMQEFSSIESCEVAGSFIESSIKDLDNTSIRMWSCVKK